MGSVKKLIAPHYFGEMEKTNVNKLFTFDCVDIVMGISAKYLDFCKNFENSPNKFLCRPGLLSRRYNKGRRKKG